MSSRPAGSTIILGDIPDQCPIGDSMILARSKTKYYGAYPSGLLERIRPLLVGGDPEATILHIPGGKAGEYNGVKGGITLTGFGINDLTVDLDPECDPDILCDVRKICDRVVAKGDKIYFSPLIERSLFDNGDSRQATPLVFPRPKAAIIDRPYSESHSENYVPGKSFLPNLNKLIRDTFEILVPWGLVGVLDYKWPSPGKEQFKCIGLHPVLTGENNDIRLFSIWKRREIQ
ncbi:hypothetical protein [Leptospira interrogans]|uniref:Uncharacterized protein n=2 Tax=Leptospira interrogans TaxID=173 RepID=A0A829D2U0_LEPIR|nr:hypothetical protein [Leptospira interrogans]EMY05383.1 hypothetical protein LEP1GSC029_3410 [Leptospira interrogans str. 2002000626]EMY24152.1 hypothetical protein LEP1GSC115_2905 [Leptospira interrogans serovar Australis str. 200703203]EKN89075.1 hypothetical protein LEP1GSC027_4225 [Leptospira interrogans str. 2002000624]EKQ36300.1 hypothetical protein LEP1GSC025_0742 [Leptospira interrogans str. 2002000621]EKQ47570.1 hypothetical protein LEP1GSC026_4650 [Leptospira interrogans str. 2002